MDNVLFEFCGNETFLNSSIFLQDKPVLSDCFLEIIPVWISCGYLWISALPFLVYMYYYKRKPLPFSYVHIIKIALCIVLVCLVNLHFTFGQMNGRACKGIEVLPAVAQAALGIRVGTFLLAAVLKIVLQRCGMKTSGLMFGFWLLLAALEAFRIYSYESLDERCSTAIVFYIYYAVILAQVLLQCIPDKVSVPTTGKVPCPQDNGSILERITFTWMFSIIYAVYRKAFDRKKMWDQTHYLKASVIGPQLETRWEAEVERKKRILVGRRSSKNLVIESADDMSASIKSEQTPLLTPKERQEATKRTRQTPKASLVKIVFRENWFPILEFLFYNWMCMLLFFLMPELLNLLIDFIDRKSTAFPVPLWLGLVYSVSTWLSLQICSIFYNIQCHHAGTLGLKIKHSLMYLVYKKALKVSKSENKISVGEIVSLLSVDCQRIQDSVFYSYYLPNSLIYVTFSAYMLNVTVGGPATAACLVTVFLFIPFNWVIAKVQKSIQEQVLTQKGYRVRLMNEVLCGIKVLKMYAWEFRFIEKINEIREKEIYYLKKNAMLMALSTSVANHSQYIIHFVLILVYCLMTPDRYISSSTVFVSLSLIVIVKYPLVLLPTILNTLVQAYVSLKRIEAFLCCSDLDNIDATVVKTADYSVYVRDGTFTWDIEDPNPCLSGINLKIRPGQLVAVVGYCGSGKSSLISAILGEMRRLSGHTQIKGTVAYVPQEAWIQNMTLRENILFGKDFNHNKYWKVIENCQLKSDLAMLDGGDNTEIGEKGTNISGGQKQRISVARAVYSNADVYFLDDPLSAVDAHVGKDLFKNVIGNSGMLKSKTRILVTHAIHWLPLMDNIVVMNNGTISEFGTYDELMTHNGAFAQFLLQHLQNEPNDDLDDPEIQWIRENMREMVETVTSEGGNSSDGTSSRLKEKKKKKVRRRNVSAMSVSQSVNRIQSTHVAMATHDTANRLTTEEVINEGSIKLEVLVEYFKAMGAFAAFLSVFLMLFYHFLSVYSMFWLTFWTEDPYLKNRSNAVQDDYADKSTNYLVIYAIMGILQGFAVLISYYLSLTRLVQASSVLHNRMLLSILRSPMSFFDSVPVGRILNRFSSDIDTLDNKLPESYRVWINMLLSTVAALVVIVISSPIFLAVVIPTVLIIVGAVYFYLPTTRKMRRIEAVTRSPIYNHFSETLTGTVVIRAYKCCSRFIKESYQRIDANSTYYFAANCGSRWIAVRLEFLGNVILFAAALLAVLTDSLNGGQLGLSITYAVQITFSLNTVVWSVMEMEMNSVSAERVHEYSILPSEAEWTVDKVTPPADWPRRGELEYRKYTTRYRPGLELVLKGISFNVQHGEKIGVVGRTGAGKSSLTLSLFRIVEAVSGAIYIDSVNIADLGLHSLRSQITILPQDPVLFSGTLKMNVDPLERFTDDEIWRALECAHLKHFAKKQPEGLYYDCGEAGQNFSVGQRQLVCLARTLLNKTKILILDEATAAVDMETDNLIQQTIRSQFTDCTILTIAHRLNTIMDYDRVMVLDKGLIKEFAPPRELLKDKEGIFHSMAKDARLV